MAEKENKIMQTIRQLGAVSSTKGTYSVNRMAVKNDKTKIILMKTVLALKLKPYYEVSELACVPQLFPFIFESSSEIVFGSQMFKLGNFGGGPVVVE